MSTPSPTGLGHRPGASMVRRFGWLASLTGLTWLVGRLRLEDHSAEHIRRAHTDGAVVYVLPRRDGFDHFALNMVLNGRNLPLSRWARGIGGSWYQPIGDAITSWRRRLQAWWRGADDPVDSGQLATWLRGRGTVTLFLDEPGRWLGTPPPDAVEFLSQLQTDCPVRFVPVMVVWDRGPETPSALRHFFLGRRDAPGWLGRVVNLVWRSREAFVHVGRPVSLQAVQERIAPERRASALRKILRRALRREDKLVRGPRLLPNETMRSLVLDNPPMRELAEREAAATSSTVQTVRQEMDRQYDRIAARFSWTVIRALHVLLQPLWTKVFSGVDVREEDLDRVRTAMRDGTPVLVPCHKSHFDYILVTWVMYHHHLIVPHVVAGMNLAVWPIDRILRGCGGFFIERRFAGKRLFPAVFGRYLRELVRQEYPIEFFIEGGRTRSGKLLQPRVGVLGMVLDAAELRAQGREVTLLPVALAYEQVAEEGAYAAELGGEPKRRESFLELLRARSVLRRRFGRVYLRVGEPIPCSELVDAHEGRPSWSQRPRHDRKELLQRVGERIIHRIGAAMVLLPTSLVALGLLAHHRRGLTDADLRERCHRFLTFLRRRDVVEAASLTTADQAITQALDRFVREGRVESLEHGEQRVWAVGPDQRITLDFYKNQVLHHFADALLVAAAVRALPARPFTEDDVAGNVRTLIWVLRKELSLDPERAARQVVDDGLDALVAHGALSHTDEAWVVADGVCMGEIHALIRPILEAYVLVARSVPTDEREPRDALIDRLQADGPARLAAGDISRPESLSRVTLKNAATALAEDGTVDRDEEGLRADASRTRWLVDTLQPMVGG